MSEDSYTPDPAAEIDTDIDRLREIVETKSGVDRLQAIIRWSEERHKADSQEANLRLLREAISVLATGKPKRFWAIAFAFGLECTQGVSQASIAKRLGITRSALNAEVMHWHDVLGGRSANLRSDQTRETYRERTIKVHARNH